MNNKKVLAFFFLCLLPTFTLHAYWVWSPEAGKFVNTEGTANDPSEEDFNYAMKLYKEKDIKQAAEEFQKVLKKFPKAKIAPEAQYRLGTIYEEKGDYKRAFKAYKIIIEKYPQSERFNEVVEREFRIGNLFLSGKKGKIAGLEILPSLSLAADVFQNIVKQAPFSEFGDKAQFHLGLTYKKWHHYSEAVDAFQAVLDHYPHSELVPQARFQLAETSYQRSATEYRDQRALDDASTQVNSFLTHYPDTSTSEKAAELRQAIDEKNAEKNYRIGLYYEKENFLESALIYYTDISKRYPDTQWGQKAVEKIKALKEPTAFHSEKEKQAAEEIQVVEAKLKAVSSEDKLERGRLKRKLERLKKHAKGLEKEKKESLERRHQDIARRERELKEKFKNLEQKKKLMKKNPSEDFKRAIERWNASLVAEQETLEQEKRQLAQWHEQMGIKEKKFDLAFLPFLGEGPTEIEKVRRIEAKKLYKLSGEKKSLLEEKELLYKHHSEVTALLNQMEEKISSAQAAKEEKELAPSSASAQENKELVEEVTRLEKELNAQYELYEKYYGKQGWAEWMNMPAQVVTTSTQAVAKSTLKILNPFSKKEGRNLEELNEHRMHLNERIAAQQNIVQTLGEAFNAELALQERKRLMASMGSQKQEDPRQLRKEIKANERQIRKRYEEIEDGHDRKKELLHELDSLIQVNKTNQPLLVKAEKAATAPAVGTFHVFKAFLFGLPNREVELTKSASQLKGNTPDTSKAKEIKDKIEYESLLIESKNREIQVLQSKLEIFKAKASLAGGYKFRSAMVRVPYLFIGEAIENAKKMIPKKKRDEMLINHLNEETQKLEKMRAELKEVDQQIQDLENQPAAPVKKEKGQTPVVTPAPAPEQAKRPDNVPDEKTLKAQIEDLSDQLKAKKEKLEPKREFLKHPLESLGSIKIPFAGGSSSDKASRRFSKQMEKLEHELKEIQGELVKTIEKEKNMEEQESKILEKRIQHIDRVMKKIQSRTLSQDLLTERDRMEERLSQLSSRKDFLNQEMKRFEWTETSSARS